MTESKARQRAREMSLCLDETIYVVRDCTVGEEPPSHWFYPATGIQVDTFHLGAPIVAAYECGEELD